MNTNQNNFDLLGESIRSNSLIKISSDLFEVGLDTFLEDGILKDIPIIGTIVGLTKAGIGIRDKLFAKKILKFLFEIKDIPFEERKDFIEKINSDPSYATKVGESILLIIDKLDDFKKAELIGKLFVYSVNGTIDYETFLRLSIIIERCFISDLSKLKLFYNGQHDQVTYFEKDLLYSHGLLKNLGIDDYIKLSKDYEQVPRKRIAFEISDYGKLIVELLLIKK
jgi:hypothetical protein